MRITYFGHSCFLVEARDHTKAIIDPYLQGSYDGAVEYDPVDETADVVLVSHDHPDHSASDTIPGEPQVFVQPVQEQVGALAISGVLTDHDETGGSERGKNTVCVLDDEDIRLVHLGDLGHLLDKDVIAKIGDVDVLLIPVGGFFTIDHQAASQVVDALAPNIVIPMHYKTPKIGFPIDGPDAFLQTQNAVQHLEDPTVEFTKASLPEQRTTLVLPYAR